MRHWQFEGQGGRLKEALLYILPLAVADWFYPRRSLPDTAPGLLQLAGQVLSALLVYDALFTVVHLLCHKVPWLYRHIHAKHHTKPVQRACEAVRLSAAEEILDVGCSVAALNLLKCHPMARLVYNIVIVYLITELHSGYDFPWSLENVVPFGLWAGSRRHEAHHRHGRLYYQKFFLPVLSEGKMMSFSKSKGSSARQDQLDNQKTRNRMGMEALSIGG
ncbi:hypothetical protein WJX72_002452 [[Myrmecia] bisecta]|uniref:Fatty acid hydroxylase domain-containing protein n=1 Tax=[Myrmecia] bisecta TaxID=41462 RepID=A0AAW1QPM3_9CHLO